MPIPLLIISDAPTSGTGLGRITKDLATRIHANLSDIYRVGTLGYGGPFSRSLGFPQYSIDMKDWVILNLPEVWEDFAGEEKGIVMTIWDASRLGWFSRPEMCEDPRLKKLLNNPPFERWGYFPIDATGPNDKLTVVLKYIIQGYDRVLAYSQWAEDILRRTLTDPDEFGLTNMPHGIDGSVFFPRNRSGARHGFGERINARTQKGKFLSVPDDSLMIGIVATNQTRKDYGTGVAAAAEMRKHRNVLLWMHSDELERHWSLPALINDYGFTFDQAVVTMAEMTDEQMSWCLSACDLTFGVGLGEGFGYPIFESLFCGTPVIHGNYGGAPEHMMGGLVKPYTTRLEGVYSCVRPVYRVEDWVDAIKEIPRGARSTRPGHLEWESLWPRWEEWFRKGITK